MLIDSPEYERVKARAMHKAEANCVMWSLTDTGFWVKDMNFKFLDISEKASEILYNLSSNDVIWYTDFEVAKKQGLKMSEAQFVEVCRGSDLFILKQPINSKYKIFRFIEFLADTKWQQHIWITQKWIFPDVEGYGKYYYWYATFQSQILGGYEQWLEWFDRIKNGVEKINDNLYYFLTP